MRQIFLECKPDEALVRRLGFPRRLVKHHNDKGKVCNVLTKTEATIGMVDEDPNTTQPRYLTTLTRLNEESLYNLAVYVDEQSKNKVIVVCPRLEEWILGITSQHAVKISQFGLPDKANKLHDIITTRLQKFEDLIDYLVDIKSPAILHLQRLLNS
ncbi:hypothetical protein ACO2Q8_21285 [Larkinella sp. VNQ87]|uniref:hypothetical protein n=1 Tax=Larkinella sp. VNQ87 TaxID=3400921 RepID=UPI003C0E53D7